MRGKGCTAVSVLAKNSGTYDNPAEEEKDTIPDKAYNSPTLLAVAKATKNNVLRVRLRNKDEDKGSKTGDLKYFNTLTRSPEGGLMDQQGAFI